MAYMQTGPAAPVQTNLDPESQKAFSLDQSENASKHLISILTNMYTRPVLAVVRETIQNALDAGALASSSNKQIKVTLPDEFTFEFTVRDYAGGMTAEELDKNIGTAGLSTKTGNAAQAGEFGIGTLAAMAYADAFTITSWKNGLKSTLSAYKKDDGSLGYSVSKPVASKNPPGTLVTVPVHHNTEDIEQFRQAYETFKFSPEIAERLDLEPHSRHDPRIVTVGRHEVQFWTAPAASPLFDHVVVLVNNIPVAANLARFPALKDFSETMFQTGSGTTLVIAFPAEAGIAVPPNRETIAVTRVNTALITNACTKYMETLTKDLEHGTPTIASGPAIRAYWLKEALKLGKKDPSETAVKEPVEEFLADKLTPYGLFAELEKHYRYHYGAPASATEVKMYFLFNGAPARPGVLSCTTRWNRGDYRWNCDLTSLEHPRRYSEAKKWRQSSSGAERPFSILPVTTKITQVIVCKEAEASLAAFLLRKDVDAWMYEIKTAHVPEDGAALLVTEAPAAESAFMQYHNPEVIDFLEFQKTHELSESNPFLTQKTERAARTARKRRQFTSEGWSEQDTLPRAGFPYVVCMRGDIAKNQFQKAYSPNWVYRDGGKELTSWLRWFEAAGVCKKPHTVTCLTEGEASGNLKRARVKLDDELTLNLQEFWAELDEDERDWLPRAWFAAALEHNAPRLLAFLRSLDASEHVAGDPDFEPVLAATRPPPSGPMRRVLRACIAELKEESDISWRFRGFTECQDLVPLEEPPFKDGTFYGLSIKELAAPAAALKRLSERSDPMAVWFRVVWYAHLIKEEATLIGQVSWFLPMPESDMKTAAMAIPNALAKAKA